MEHTIIRDGIRLSYERRGSGPMVVLVQGLWLSGRMWLQLPGGLVKSGFSVLTPDNRGTGRSDAPTPPYTMGQMADDLAAVIRHAGGGPAIVVGISLGGMICQHLALRHPDLVAALVLAATTCGPPLGRPPGLRVAWTLVRSTGGSPRAVRRVHALLVHPDTLARNPGVFDQWERVMREEPLRWRGHVGQVLAVGLHSTGLWLGRIRCPTVVITGANDRIVHPVNSRILAARIPDAELVVLERAGHAFPLEHPGALPAAIQRVARRLAAPG